MPPSSGQSIQTAANLRVRNAKRNNFYQRSQKVYGQPGIDKGVSTYLNAPLIVSNGTTRMASVSHLHAENAQGVTTPLLQRERAHIDFIRDDIRERAHEFIVRYIANDMSLHMESALFRRFHHVLSSYDALLTDAEKQVRDTLQRKRLTKEAMASRLNLNANLENSDSAKAMRAVKQQMAMAGGKAREQLELAAKMLAKRIAGEKSTITASQPSTSVASGPHYYTFSHSIPEGGVHHITVNTNPTENAIVVENLSRNIRVFAPVRGLHGDRLLKRAIVLDSIMPAIHSIMRLPTDSESDLTVKGRGIFKSPFLKRFVQSATGGSLRSLNLEQESTKWSRESGSFGDRGPQAYWVQFVRELYDHRRMRNVMQMIKNQSGQNIVERVLGKRINRVKSSAAARGDKGNNGRKKANTGDKNARERNASAAKKSNLRRAMNGSNSLSTNRVENHAVDSTRKYVGAYKALQGTLSALPANLGVTEYGYTADINNINAEWTISYHRLGRRWYLDDVDLSSAQLPFGAFADSFLHPNRVSRVSSTAAHPAGQLVTVIQNTIASTILARDDERGTGGRYGHVHTSGISMEKNVDVFNRIKSIRSYQYKNGSSVTAARILKKNVRNENVMMFGPSVELLALRASRLLAFNGVESTTPENADQTARNDADEYFKSSLGNGKFLKDAFFIRANTMQNKYEGKTESEIQQVLRENISQERKNFILKGKLDAAGSQVDREFGKVTAYNITNAERAKHAFGLKKAFNRSDATTLDEAVLLIDAEVYCGVEAPPMVTHGGGNDALGIRSALDSSSNIVLPQITPITRVGNKAYTQMRSSADKFAALLRKDADGSLAGLLQRIMENVIDPLITGGGLSRGMHMADLMARFSHIVDSLDLKSAALVDSLFRHEKYYNMIRALVFYMYSSAGLSQRAALDRLLLVEASRDQNEIRLQQLNLVVRLRLVGEHGFAPTPMFKRIVRQFFATTDTNAMTKTYSYDDVWREVERIRRTMGVLKLPKAFRRYLYKNTGTPLTSSEAVMGGRRLVSMRALTNRTGIRPNASKAINAKNRRMVSTY